LRIKRKLTKSQVRTIKSAQIKLVLQRHIPEGILDHARSSCDKDHTGKRKEDKWELRRICNIFSYEIEGKQAVVLKIRLIERRYIPFSNAWIAQTPVGN
jgi:hypothetical protein